MIGLHKSDPRLRPMMEKIYEIERQTEEMDNEAKVTNLIVTLILV